MAELSLADFVDRERFAIVARWESFANTQLPAAASLTKKGLRDHAAEIISAIVEDLRSSQILRERQKSLEGRDDASVIEEVGKVHGLLRFKCGFQLDQVVAEFRALRASILKSWKEQAGDDPEGEVRFNEAIDEALSQSVNQYVEAVNEIRDRFIGVLGHDLRNPLVAITMGAQLLINTEQLSEHSTLIVGRILSCAQRMQRMIVDLHDLTRTKFGDLLLLEKSEMDIAVVCRQIIDEFEVIFPDRVLSFTAKGYLRGIWDRDRLAQALSNLVQNAYRHGRKNSPIRISAEGGVDEVLVKVHNRGNPIAPEEQALVFEPMVILGKEGMGKEGLGLGLYIVAQIIVAHGGRVEVSSSEKDGTTFSLHLPRNA